MTGIFLGSFNPMHIGHINIISSTLNQCKDINEILVIPAWQNPNKESTNNYNSRVYMCKSLVGEYFDSNDYFNVKVSLIEGIVKPKYTIDLLNYIKEKQMFPYGYKIIITDETFLEICEGRWHLGSEILANNEFIIFCTNYNLTYDCNNFICKFKNEGINVKAEVKYIQNEISISSTKIREMLNNGICPIPFINKCEYDEMKRNK